MSVIICENSCFQKGTEEHLPKEAGYWAILYWHTLAGGNGKLESQAKKLLTS
jgi:hypothetical protein